MLIPTRSTKYENREALEINITCSPYDPRRSYAIVAWPLYHRRSGNGSLLRYQLAVVTWVHCNRSGNTTDKAWMNIFCFFEFLGVLPTQISTHVPLDRKLKSVESRNSHIVKSWNGISATLTKKIGLQNTRSSPFPKCFLECGPDEQQMRITNLVCPYIVRPDFLNTKWAYVRMRVSDKQEDILAGSEIGPAGERIKGAHYNKT